MQTTQATFHLLSHTLIPSHSIFLFSSSPQVDVSFHEARKIRRFQQNKICAVVADKNDVDPTEGKSKWPRHESRQLPVRCRRRQPCQNFCESLTSNQSFFSGATFSDFFFFIDIWARDISSFCSCQMYKISHALRLRKQLACKLKMPQSSAC